MEMTICQLFNMNVDNNKYIINAHDIQNTALTNDIFFGKVELLLYRGVVVK